jgi:flagellar assembly factor FliW
MKTCEKIKTKKKAAKSRNVVKLPYGLIGFERVTNYALLYNPAEKPFLWFQMLDGAKHAFLLLPPREIVRDYQPDLRAEDVRFLGLNDPSEALVLNIVTLHGPGKSTVNLKGPIVINRRTLVGKQVIPKNAAQYPAKHPLSAS